MGMHATDRQAVTAKQTGLRKHSVGAQAGGSRCKSGGQVGRLFIDLA